MVVGRSPMMVTLFLVVPRITGLRSPLCWIVFFATIVAASFDFVVKPEFGEKPSDLNVTTFAGQTGRLPCTVKHLARKRVSWIRGRDLQVLSTGRETFSTDLRISVLPGTAKFKTRRPRHITTQPCHDCGPHLPRNTTGATANDDQRRGWDPTHCLCVDTWKKLQFVQDVPGSGRSTRVVINSIPSDGRTMNIYESHTTRGEGFIKRQAHVDDGIPRRVWSRDKQASDRGRLRTRRDYEFRHKNTDYSRAKKSLSTLSRLSQYTKPSHSKYNQTPGKHYGDGGTHAYTQHDSPIAIYSQGPTSNSMENKGLQPGPNYIDGVWEPEDYTLQIKFTKPEDAGTYICQINTEPKVSQVIQLSVVKMSAEIVGSSELFVKAGTPVTLACRVNHGTLMPGFILWYKGERLVEYDRSGGRIQVMTGTEGVSHLLLQDARPSDSANYTCSPSGGVPASLILNVIVDERQAAMQQGNSASLLPSSLGGVLLLQAWVLTWFTQDDAYVSAVTVVLAGLLWWMLGTLPHTLCISPAYTVAFVSLCLAVVVSRTPAASAPAKVLLLAPTRAECVAGVGLTLCHIQSVMMVVCLSFCVIMLLSCHSSRLQNYV
ncbi:uncharacterized protein [Panulirus ornatus]|uniref:uncharacterized protein n=1 Tax=Panulirus ornatus TaxID=150431 RepID=UPI003A899835